MAQLYKLQIINLVRNYVLIIKLYILILEGKSIIIRDVVIKLYYSQIGKG